MRSCATDSTSTPGAARSSITPIASASSSADAAPAEDHVERVAQPLRAAPRRQQARQALRAAVTRQQVQADFGLAEARAAAAAMR